MSSVDDVKMKDLTLDKKEDSNIANTKKIVASKVVTPYEQLKENLALLKRCVNRKDPRIVRRVLRRTTSLRMNLKPIDLQRALQKYMPKTATNKNELLSALDQLVAAEPKDTSGMDVEEEAKADRPDGSDDEATVISLSALPEVEVYLHLLVVAATLKRSPTFIELGARLSALLVDRLLEMEPRHTIDLLGARAYQHFSTAHEALGKLDEIRQVLLTAHRTACLRHDDMGQATLINLLLRNYLNYNLYDQALLLVENSSDFPATVSNNQFVRHLYYRGLIDAVQLEYTEAHQKLVQALRKAPQATATGFRLTVQRLAIVVQLLMAEVPERSVFNQDGMRKALIPYLKLTQTVRQGEISAFTQILNEYNDSFAQDGTLSLVLRLRHSVIKTGLRNISLSYSKISFADVAEKLKMDGATDAEHVCAKAIMDGVIDATLDHDGGFLRSNETGNAYGTSQPQQAFNSRIEFCLEVRNDAVKGMQYPPNAHKKLLKEVNEEAKKNEDELAAEIEEGKMDEDDDED
jgi:26S proteasome regulatory subunit N3